MRMRLWHTKICYEHACVCGIQRCVHALVCGIQRFVQAHFVTRHHQLKSIILMRQNATDFYKQLLSLLKSSPQDIDCAPAHHSVRTQDVCAFSFLFFLNAYANSSLCSDLWASGVSDAHKSQRSDICGNGVSDAHTSEPVDIYHSVVICGHPEFLAETHLTLSLRAFVLVCVGVRSVQADC